MTVDMMTDDMTTVDMMTADTRPLTSGLNSLFFARGVSLKLRQNNFLLCTCQPVLSINLLSIVPLPYKFLSWCKSALVARLWLGSH